MQTLNDTKVYVGVTPETDPRQNMTVGSYTSDEISRHGFGEEPNRSNAQLLMKNITGGEEFDFYPFDLIYATDVIPSDGIIREISDESSGIVKGSMTQRDFVRPPFRNKFSYIAEKLKEVAYKKSRGLSFKEMLESLGNHIQNEIVAYARRQNFDPNPEVYAKMKDGKPPLELTGQMLESITSEVDDE